MTGGRLAGRRILVTRTREQAAGLVDALHARGAEAVVVPLIATQPAATPDEIVAAATALSAASPPRWAAFTSATAVRLVLGAAGAFALHDVHVAAVGIETARALDAAGVGVDIAGAGDAAALAARLEAAGMAAATVWFPSAEAARPDLPQRLGAAGALVIVQPVYRTLMPEDAPRRLMAALARGIDAVTLTSGSTARNLVHALGDSSLPATTRVVCIGAQTAREARVVGLDVTAIALEPTVESLIIALDSVG
ncbi:MAG: uroporphyrinogen-III synthase [Candidatus Dormibacteraeota bacterium]|nr:uroporphyrinogen-III synthase [Candidatus Dormibacteraeota bacterium]